MLEDAGRKGRAVLHDIDVDLSGINAYFQSTHQNVAAFTRNDIYAFNALKDQFVGEGGGNEARRAQVPRRADPEARPNPRVGGLQDPREAHDPEAPATLPGRTSLLAPTRSTTGNVIPDAGSYTLTPSQHPAAARARRHVETLCGHSGHRYVFSGACRPMQRFDAGTLNGKPISFYCTIHGLATGYARVHRRLVALSRKRASYGQDVRDLLFYHDLSDGRVRSVTQFYRAADQTPQTFNSFYMDAEHIACSPAG